MKIRYYQTTSGRCPVLEFLEDLNPEIFEKYLELVSLLEKGLSIPMPLSRPLSSIYPGLHEMRLKDQTGAYRIFYYIKKHDGIFMIHGFKKKTQNTPKKEILTTLKRIGDL